MKFTRITVHASQMGGVPCIRGLRIPVATVVGMVADGMREAEILKTYPDLDSNDIHEALQYAAEAVRARLAEWTRQRGESPTRSRALRVGQGRLQPADAELARGAARTGAAQALELG